MDPDHPKETLLFYISDDIVDESNVALLKELIARLAQSRDWATSPPVFVDNEEDDSEPGSLRTVGGFMELYSGRVPWDERLPVEVDRAHLDEVRTIVDALAIFSAETRHEIAFELNGAQVEWVEKGVPDNSLRVGILEELERSLR